MLKALRAYNALASNHELRALARNGSGHLFSDIGLSREAFVDATEEQLRKRYWWYL